MCHGLVVGQVKMSRIDTSNKQYVILFTYQAIIYARLWFDTFWIMIEFV